jgi:hypothetical protein
VAGCAVISWTACCLDTCDGESLGVVAVFGSWSVHLLPFTTR